MFKAIPCTAVTYISCERHRNNTITMEEIPNVYIHSPKTQELFLHEFISSQSLIHWRKEIRHNSNTLSMFNAQKSVKRNIQKTTILLYTIYTGVYCTWVPSTSDQVFYDHGMVFLVSGYTQWADNLQWQWRGIGRCTTQVFIPSIYKRTKNYATYALSTAATSMTIHKCFTLGCAAIICKQDFDLSNIYPDLIAAADSNRRQYEWMLGGRYQNQVSNRLHASPNFSAVKCSLL